MMLTKVKVTCDLRRIGKNLYTILAYVKPAMIKAKKEKKYYEMLDKVNKKLSFDKAMKVIRKYVKFVEPQKVKEKGNAKLGY